MANEMWVKGIATIYKIYSDIPKDIPKTNAAKAKVLGTPSIAYGVS